MANRIPGNIGRAHILAAIHDLIEGRPHRFGPSTHYDLLFEGHRLPPKAVLGVAAGEATGGAALGPADFSGGLNSKCFRVLEENGFTIVPKGDATQISSTSPQLQQATHKRNPGKERDPSWEAEEAIIALDFYLRTRPTHPGKTSPEILGLSQALNRLGERLFSPELRTPKLRNANGVYMKLMNFRSFDPTYTANGRKGLTAFSTLDREIWKEYSDDPERCQRTAAAILATIDAPEFTRPWEHPAPDPGIEEAPEGRLLTRIHSVREREPALRDSKIKSVLKQSGKLECEVCAFNFASAYGQHGAGFIECHHTKPVASLVDGARTHIRDLALVCSNCHRMIHRRSRWLSIAEMRALYRDSESAGAPHPAQDTANKKP